MAVNREQGFGNPSGPHCGSIRSLDYKMICQEIPSSLLGEMPVLVVGAGPAGIVQALELRRRGIAVTMLAGGTDGFSPEFQALADAEIADKRRHATMQIAVRRALGGTSLL